MTSFIPPRSTHPERLARIHAQAMRWWKGTTMTTVTVQSRTIGGHVYLSAVDMVARLRGRADEVEALAMGDELTAEQYETAVAYHTTARELRQRADWIDLAVIEHLTDHPGDSDPLHSA